MKNDNKKITESYKNRNKPRGRSRYKQGYFIPTNLMKYIGDIRSIIYIDHHGNINSVIIVINHQLL